MVSEADGLEECLAVVTAVESRAQEVFVAESLSVLMGERARDDEVDL